MKPREQWEKPIKHAARKAIQLISIFLLAWLHCLLSIHLWSCPSLIFLRLINPILFCNSFHTWSDKNTQESFFFEHYTLHMECNRMICIGRNNNILLANTNFRTCKCEPQLLKLIISSTSLDSWGCTVAQLKTFTYWAYFGPWRTGDSSKSSWSPSQLMSLKLPLLLLLWLKLAVRPNFRFITEATAALVAPEKQYPSHNQIW